MKKYVLMLGLVSTSLFANAQREADHSNNEGKEHACAGTCCGANGLKAGKGDVTAELGLTNLFSTTNFGLNEGGTLRFRYFAAKNVAIRLGVNVNSFTETENVYSVTGQKGILKAGETNVTLNLGAEYHFEGTKRLSPYVGADILLGFGGTKETAEDSDGNVFVAGENHSMKGSYFTIGFRGLFGADYYISKNVYIGAEAGLGFAATMDGKTEIEHTIGGTSTSTTIESAGSNFGLAPAVHTGVRIGFVF